MAPNRSLDALLALPFIHIEADDIDFTIYADGNVPFPQGLETARFDMTKVTYVPKCKGDEIFWEAALELYETGIKFIPKNEADLFIDSCSRTHIQKTSISIGKHRINSALKKGSRNPEFADVVILSLFYDRDSVVKRPWYSDWAETYNVEFEMPDKIRNLMAPANLPDESSRRTSPAKKQAAAAMETASVSNESNQDTDEQIQQLAMKATSPEGSAGSIYSREETPFFQRALGTDQSPVKGVFTAVAESPGGSNDQYALKRSLEALSRVKQTVEQPMPSPTPYRELQSSANVTRPGHSRSATADSRSRKLDEAFPASMTIRTDLGFGNNSSEAGNKRQRLPSTGDGLFGTPSPSPRQLPSAHAQHAQHEQQQTAPVACMAETAPIQQQAGKTTPVHEERVANSRPPTTELPATPVPQLPVQKQAVSKPIRTPTQSKLQQLEAAFAEEQGMLAKAKDMEATLEVKREEVKNWKMELEKMESAVGDIESDLMGTYEKLAAARGRSFD